MIIEKVFSNIEEPTETLYSVLLNQKEFANFSRFIGRAKNNITNAITKSKGYNPMSLGGTPQNRQAIAQARLKNINTIKAVNSGQQVPKSVVKANAKLSADAQQRWAMGNPYPAQGGDLVKPLSWKSNQRSTWIPW